jgi:hypothetical protein
MKGNILANSSKTAKRRELDFYPTPPDVTVALMDFLALDRDTSIWEPACGDGAMAEVLKRYVPDVHATELREDGGYGVGGVDFLQTINPVDAIITNPPFNASEQFILHSLGQAKIVAMLLKSQYWHAKKRTELFEQSRPSFILPLNWRPDFTGGERGGAPTMEVAWTVWIQGQTDTRYQILRRPK